MALAKVLKGLRGLTNDDGDDVDISSLPGTYSGWLQRLNADVKQMKIEIGEKILMLPSDISWHVPSFN